MTKKLKIKVELRNGKIHEQTVDIHPESLKVIDAYLVQTVSSEVRV